MSDQPAGTEEVTRWATTRLELTEALRQAQAGRLYVTDSWSAADALLEHLTPLPGESAAVPEPVMVLLEDAWTLIANAPGILAEAGAWRQRYEAVIQAHAAAPAREAAGEQAAAEVHEICPARHPEHATPCTWLAGHGTVHRDADDAIWSDSAGRVTVAKSDLSSILAAAWGMTGDAGAFNRLAEACGLVSP